MRGNCLLAQYSNVLDHGRCIALYQMLEISSDITDRKEEMTVNWNSKVDSQLYENLKWEEWRWGMHLLLKNTTVLLLKAVQ